jgi:hypothetical protein
MRILLLWTAACVLAGCGDVLATQPRPTDASDASSSAGGKTCRPDGIIDDAEDDNNQVAANEGRNGYWYTFADKAGSTITPAAGSTFAMSAGGAGGSAHAAHMSGKVGGGAIVYAGMGFNFIDPKGPYDAKAYKGISFWAKAGPGSNRVRVKMTGAEVAALLGLAPGTVASRMRRAREAFEGATRRIRLRESRRAP